MIIEVISQNSIIGLMKFKLIIKFYNLIYFIKKIQLTVALVKFIINKSTQIREGFNIDAF